MARAEERQEILGRKRNMLTMEGEKLMTQDLPDIRPFRQAGTTLEHSYEANKAKNKQCNTCTKIGHGWSQFPEISNRDNHWSGRCGKMGPTKGCWIRGRYSAHKESKNKLRKHVECKRNQQVDDHQEIRVEK